MIKIRLYIILLINFPAVCIAQHKLLTDLKGSKRIDSLKIQLSEQKNDSARVSILDRIGFSFEVLNVDSSLKYYRAALTLAHQRGYAWGESRVMTSQSSIFRQQGKLSESLDMLAQALKIAIDNNLQTETARAYRRTADIYIDLEDFPKAVEYALLALHMDEKYKNVSSAEIGYWTLADAYEKMNKLDSATIYLNKAYGPKTHLNKFIYGYYEVNGNIHARKGNDRQAIASYSKGLMQTMPNSDLVSSSRLCAGLSAVFKNLNQKDSAIFYAMKGLELSQQVPFKKGIIDNARLLSDLYDSTKPAAALKYYKIAVAAKDSLFGVNNIQTMQNLVTRESARLKEREAERISYRNKLIAVGLVTGLAALIITAFILYRNNRQKQKANKQLHGQNEKIAATLSELKSTQALLIQSEKMASLGQLTAGIAHEIQNPLNFVNNFSDVNKEMLIELSEEIDKENYADAKAIAKDVIANEEKINQHGKRADAIVKGMLQHSQSGNRQKESVDINALADEYLRLSFHGFRAKDKSFNATINTDFDKSIGNINILPQDIGRVLMNLYNNAFYAATLPPPEKIGTGTGGFSDSAKRESPTVWVSTKKVGDKVLISVRDNGAGIPDNIVDKIFQPFFTTKPTGQGTGLGLSLSYDIVKAHGGELTVKTKEGVFAEFTITLPCEKSILKFVS